MELKLAHVAADWVQDVSAAHEGPVHHAKRLTTDVGGKGLRCGCVPPPDFRGGYLVSVYALALEPFSEFLLCPCKVG